MDEEMRREIDDIQARLNNLVNAGAAWTAVGMAVAFACGMIAGKVLL